MSPHPQGELTAAERADTLRIDALARALLERLRALKPVFLDLSIAEPAVGTPLGHTVRDKFELLRLGRRMGFRDILLATFDVPLPDEPQVDDDFVEHLVARGEDLTGCFAFTQLGRIDENGAYQPDHSMVKTQRFGIPNTLVDLRLSRAHVPLDPESRRIYLDTLQASIDWFHVNLRGDGGIRPRIYLNYQDLPDAYFEDREWVMEVTKFLSTQPIAAVTFEDGRGTLFPFQVGAIAATLRRLLPQEVLVLIHVHSGNGMENACVLEALLQGADGMWAGFVKEAAIIGHASSAELLANLVRIDNPHVKANFRVDELLPIARQMTQINTGNPAPDDIPIIGANAYRVTLPFFEQKTGCPMDLPPERVGGSYGYRITPVASDGRVIAGRLQEVLGIPAETITQPLLDTMIRLMRRDMRAGNRIAYDQPDQLRSLHARACTIESQRSSAEARGGAKPPGCDA